MSQNKTEYSHYSRGLCSLTLSHVWLICLPCTLGEDTLASPVRNLTMLLITLGELSKCIYFLTLQYEPYQLVIQLQLIGELLFYVFNILTQICYVYNLIIVLLKLDVSGCVSDILLQAE